MEKFDSESLKIEGEKAKQKITDGGSSEDLFNLQQVVLENVDNLSREASSDYMVELNSKLEVAVNLNDRDGAKNVLSNMFDHKENMKESYNFDIEAGGRYSKTYEQKMNNTVKYVLVDNLYKYSDTQPKIEMNLKKQNVATDYYKLSKKTNPEAFGAYITDPNVKELDFENMKFEVLKASPEFFPLGVEASSNILVLEQALSVLEKDYSDKYELPGFESAKYFLHHYNEKFKDNANRPDLIFPGALFYARDGKISAVVISPKEGVHMESIPLTKFLWGSGTVGFSVVVIKK